MKTLKTFLFVFFIVGCTTVFAQQKYDQLTYPKLKSYNIPKVETFKLRNGITFYLLEDHELPLINLHAMVRTGSILDPSGKVGLADLTGMVMRNGGSEKYPADSLNKILEDHAAKMSISIGTTSGSANLNVLKKDFDSLLPIFIDVLRHPSFPKDKIELAKKRLKSSISRRNDDSQSIAFREFRRLIYGPHSVYGRLEQYQTIDNIKRNDMIAYHQSAFGGSNLMIGIVGDFNIKSMKKILKKTFDHYPKGKSTNLEFPKVNYNYAQTINFINKSNINQSVVLMGHLGGFRKNPDYAALQVMNQVLSGGFSGRLMQHVRTDLGLAYAVFGNYNSNVFYPGVFYAGVMTKSATTAKAIDAVKNEIVKLQQKPITEKELKDTKEQFLNSLVFRYDSRSKILNKKMQNAYDGMPSDAFEKYVNNVKAVTIADVQRVAKKYLKPDKMQILVVGNKQQIGDQLQKYGKVNDIDITIPEPNVSDNATSAKGDVKQGQFWLEKMANAILKDGKKFKSVTTSEQSTQYNAQLPGGKMTMSATSTVTFPDQMTTKINTPGGTVTMTLKDGKVERKFGDRTLPSPPQLAEILSESLKRNYLSIALNSKSEKPEFMGMKTVDGTKLAEIKIPQKKPVHFFIDTSTGLPQYMQYTTYSPAAGGKVKVKTTFSDWKTVDGISYAFKEVTTQNGKKASESDYNKVSIN
ncbi:MAG TPA: pitrilysin family protein [Balneolales bacterium]|nr:pitrilysin family protein [Balneolales bacterium]